LREVPRLAAEIRVDLAADGIPALVEGGGLFIASVHPWVRWPSREPPSRGGHLVLVFGGGADGLRFHNPSGHDDAAQQDARLTVEDFARFYAGRGIWLPG
jgi:hypothetical protein